jgi:hypothetical protein
MNSNRIGLSAALALGAVLMGDVASAEPGRRRISGSDDAPRPTRAPDSDEASEDGETPTRLILGIERLFGFRRQSIESVEAEIENEGETFTLLTPMGATSFVPSARIGLDFTLGDLTLGGSAAFAVSGNTSLLHLAPRVGVLMPLSEGVALWLRGGLSLNQTSIDSEEATVTLLALSLDPQIILSPSPAWGVTLGLGLDIPLSGTFTSDFSGESVDFTVSDYGLNAGLVIWL